MTNIDKMWDALATHQKIANKKGYGKEWEHMCTERTWADAYDACRAAWAVHDAANPEARNGICNAAYAADYASSSDVAPAAAARAISYITKANQEADHV